MRLLALVTVTLAGCATSQDANRDVRTTHLVCGATTRLDVNHDGRFAVVRTSEGSEITLRRSDTPQGVRYEAEGVSVLRSGDTYVFKGNDGDVTSCSLLER